MPNAVEVWVSWMQQQEATELIDDINRTPRRQRMPTARQLGKRLRVTNGERERLKLWTIAASDLTAQEVLAWRRAKEAPENAGSGSRAAANPEPSTRHNLNPRQSPGKRKA
jgi:hypothetical protein